MKKFIDDLDEKLHSFLSLNFLLAEKQGEVIDEEDFAKCNVYSNNMYVTFSMYKCISRTFDIGECLNEG